MALPISPYTVLIENRLATNRSYPPITLDTKITAAVAMGAQLNEIALYNNGGDVDFNIGTTLGGTELYAGILVSGAVDTYVFNIIFSVSAATDIYFSSANWNAAELHIVVQTQSIYQIV